MRLKSVSASRKPLVFPSCIHREGTASRKSNSLILHHMPQKKKYSLFSFSPTIPNVLMPSICFNFLFFSPGPQKRNILCLAYCVNTIYALSAHGRKKSRKTFTKKRYKIGLKKIFWRGKTPAKNRASCGVFSHRTLLFLHLFPIYLVTF